MRKLLFSLLAISTLWAHAQESEQDSILVQRLDEVTVSSRVIDVAKQRATPVAVSSISSSEISLKTGNQEFPEIMKGTPSVYATKQGGGYGDSRISLRGFDQRNTSFLINGQPVNDMENGWVYWSNWQGLTDVASGIQIQRGLGASRLAVPSVGGTVSIFTKTAELSEGGTFSQTIGNDGFTKTTAAYNTGLSDSGWATSVLLSKWAGDGYVYGTSGEGLNYFFALGYAPQGSAHSLNLSILGAGQWHHQRSSWVSIRDYQNFGTPGKIDPRWNTDAGILNGEEYNMRRNFYNKPLATLNWDWDINSTTKLNTSLYASAGRGGGTGPRGNNFRNADIDFYPFNKDLSQHYLGEGRGTRLKNGFVDFDKAIEVNQSSTSPYTGSIAGYSGKLIGSNGFRDDGVNRAVLVRRASMNSHDWVGAISNLEKDLGGGFRASIGVDLRSYKGYHYRVLNDLLGLDGYYSTGNKNSAGKIIETTVTASPFKNTGLKGPMIDYYNVGIVGWQGLNGMVEHTSADNKVNAVIQFGKSNQSFQREDLFDQPGLPISEKANQGGGYLKTGANYNINEKSNVFFNTGFINRQPQFDAVFPNFANVVNPDLRNEKIRSFEIGYGYKTDKLDVNVNAYATSWGNRFVSRSLFNAQGDQGTAQFKDVSESHKGIEIEGTYRPVSKLKLKGSISVGDWKYTKDFKATLFDANQQEIGEGVLYLKGAKVGDAAQVTTFWSADYYLGDIGLGKVTMDASYRTAGQLYADYAPTDAVFTKPDNAGPVKLPSYGLVDMGLTSRFNAFGNKASFRVNVNNVFNTLYISESETNIHADGNAATWKGVDVRNSVWFGFGSTWNAALKYTF